jgi:hypothetical protein
MNIEVADSARFYFFPELLLDFGVHDETGRVLGFRGW